MIKRFIIRFLQFQIITGLFLALNTAGASDLDLISLKQIVIRLLISIGLMLLGYVGIKMEELYYEH